MFAPSISRRAQLNPQWTPGSPPVNCQLQTLNSRRYFPAFTLERHRDPESIRGFTLIELLVVVGIVALLLVLIAPAFTYIKGGTDVTSAAYTIKGVLDTARTYAKANNTYSWVGFAGSIGDNITGQVQLVVVASKDGTDPGHERGRLSWLDGQSRLRL